MTTDEKYSRRNMLNFTQQLEAPYLKNKRLFLDFLMTFLKCALNLEHLEKKISILAELFPELWTPKEVVT